MRRNQYPITTYCVHYDPYYCDCDPEYIWQIVQAAGGSVHAGYIGCMDFYVPEKLIGIVMLIDKNLKILESKSYC